MGSPSQAHPSSGSQPATRLRVPRCPRPSPTWTKPTITINKNKIDNFFFKCIKQYDHNADNALNNKNNTTNNADIAQSNAIHNTKNA